MVNSVPHEGLDPIELKCAELLEAGREITIDSLGGLGKIFQSASRLSASPLMPDILTALIAFGTQHPLSEPELLKDTFAKLVTDLTDEFALMGAIDALDACRPLPGPCDEVFSLL